MNILLFIKNLPKFLNPTNTYNLFYIYVITAIYLILINDIGVIVIDKSTIYDIGAVNQPLIDLVNLKYPVLSKYPIIINYLYFFESGEESSILEISMRIIFILMVVLMFSLVVILAAKFLIELLKDKLKTLYINGILFFLTNIYIIFYPLHVISRGCAVPIIITEMFKMVSILIGMLITVFLLKGLVSFIEFMKIFFKKVLKS